MTEEVGSNQDREASAAHTRITPRRRRGNWPLRVGFAVFLLSSAVHLIEFAGLLGVDEDGHWDALGLVRPWLLLWRWYISDLPADDRWGPAFYGVVVISYLGPIANVLILTVAAALLTGVIGRVFRVTRHRLPRTEPNGGMCRQCGYRLMPAQSRCPECGLDAG